MNTVVTLGPSAVDFYFVADVWPALGEKVMLTERQMRIGGMIANTSSALAAAGAHVTHLERIGPNHADAVTSSLATYGVDTSLMQVSPTGRTCETYVVRVGPERSILIDDGGREVLEVTPQVQAAVADAAVVVTSPHELRQPTLRDLVFSAASAGGPRIAMDIETPGLTTPDLDRDSILAASFLVINEQAAAAVGLDLRELAADTGDGSREILVTRGARGVDIIGPDGDLHVPATPIEAVDTTGASDTFFGAYVAQRLTGALPRQAAEFAVIAAAHATAAVGPRAGADYLATLGRN